MNYKKYQTPAYNLHTIKTDKFKTITIKINFKRKIEQEEIVFRNLLADVLFESSKKYPTCKSIITEATELYGLKLGSYVRMSGNYSIMSFSCHFLNEAYTEPGMIEASIDFLMEFLFQPNSIQKSFEHKSFQLAKNALKEMLEASKENFRKYSLERLYEEMGQNEVYGFNANGTLEDLEKVNETNLYAYYESILKSDIIDIFVIGNVEEHKIKNMIQTKFAINTLKKPSTTHYIEHHKFRKKPNTITEKNDSKQSFLHLGFKIEPLTDFEKKYVMSVYNYILGGGPDSKLFQSVREKNSLCYSIYSSYSPVLNILRVSSGIDASSYKKAVTLIKKEIKNMEKGEFEEIDIEKAKITYLDTLKVLEDSADSCLSIYQSHEYLGYDFLDERAKNIKEVTKEMVWKVAKKIHLDTIYFLEGEELNERNKIK